LATFWQFLSLLWEIFMNIFRTRGFSTVSLDGTLVSLFGHVQTVLSSGRMSPAMCASRVFPQGTFSVVLHFSGGNGLIGVFFQSVFLAS
jgi:hypothetical protein